MLGVVAALLVIVVVVIAVAVVARHGADRADSGPDPGGDPTSTASSYDDSRTGAPTPTGSGRPVACDQADPDASPDQETRSARDGRVHGGPLSFAQLGSPWTSPESTSRVPYSRDSQVQTYRLPEKLPWQASAQVGIATFAPFPGGAPATSAMLQCVLTSDFYTDVDVRLVTNTVTTLSVDGRRATERNALLRFSHPDLSTRGSLLRFVVVESDPVTYYFSAVPMERADLISQLDTATESLRLS